MSTRPAGFPRGLRLRKRREFLSVYDQGIRVPGERLVLFVVGTTSGHPRLGLTATRKVGGSVQRNRARRQLRDAFRRNRERFDSWDVVVNVRTKAVGATTRQIETELLALARRAERMIGRGDRPTRPTGAGVPPR